MDPDAVLSPAISLESLEPILRRRGQIAKFMSAVEHLELSSRHPFDTHKPRHAGSGEELLGSGIREGNDHPCIV